jgi:hypothetical protein
MSPSIWRLERLGRLRIAWAERPAAAPERLHARERAALDKMDLAHRRRAEWTAGRLGLARLLPPGTHVASGPDGAPEVVGAAWAASIAHEDGWVAVAARPGAGRVAIDLVPHGAAPAAARALARARVNGGGGEPAATWAAVECAAKLCRLGVGFLLDDRRVEVADLGGDRLAVSGLGPRVARVQLRRLPGAVIAVADEP